MRIAISLPGVLLACCTAAGCNLVLGINEGELFGESSGAGAGGQTTTATGGGGAGGTGTAGTGSGTAGTGGMASCPVEKVVACDADGNGGAVCDPIRISEESAGHTIGLAMVGDYLHWASGDGKVVRVCFDGTPDSKFGDGQDSVFAAADANNVYWTDWYDDVIRSATLDSSHTLSDVTSFVGGVMPRARLGRIVLGGDQLYWAGEDPGAVWTARADGSEPFATKVADKVDDTENADVSIGVAIDSTHLYFTDAGKVLRIPVGQVGDPQAVTVSATDAGAGEVVVDEARVYWTSTAGVASLKKDQRDPLLLPA